MKNLQRLLAAAAILSLALASILTASAQATGTTAYDSVPAPLPPNFPSLGYQATQTTELGDHIAFTGTERQLTSVTAALSIWARHSEYPAMPAEGFTHPITLNLYQVNNSGATPAVGALIASVTDDFLIPWRPEGDPTCPNTGYGEGFAWRASDGQCYNGYAFTIVFDLASQNLVLPDEIIYGLAYNTQTYGAAPLGANGPYNSLNFGLADASAPTVGTDVNADVVFWNTSTAGWYTDRGVGGVGVFRPDTHWTGYVPAVRFEVAAPPPELTVQVQDSLGNPIEGAAITYAVGSPNGGWSTFGTTGADGTVSRTDLTVGTTYHFYATYAASTALTQVLTFDGDDDVVFTTTPVKVKVETCPGAALEGAAVYYGSANGGFYAFGTTGADGVAAKELFAGYDRTFYASLNHTTSAQQTAAVAAQAEPLVTFKTTKVTLTYSGGVLHGSANGGWYTFTQPSLEMFAGAHTFKLGSLPPTTVNVSGCALEAGSLTVKFPGIASVHTYVRKSDGVAGAAGGAAVAEQTYKNDQAVFASLPNGVYDLALVKGAKTLVVDDVIVIGNTVVEDLVATLTVDFPGIAGVHTYVKTTTGGGVDERTYKNDSASLAVLKALYKVTVVKGAQQNTYDVDCSLGDCVLDDITATLTVNFPGIAGVHTYVKTTGGGGVDERTYKNNSASLAVLRALYKVTVVKGAQSNTYDVDCSLGDCTLTGLVATLTVKFPGLSGVHTYVKVNDGAAGTAAGGGVDERTYQTNETSLAVLKAFYDVVVVRGAKTYLWDAVDCTGETCTLDKATLTVKFPGLASVHTYVKKSDGVAGAATGQQVAAQTYKNDQAVFSNLATGLYDVVVVKGARTLIVDDVAALGGNATVDDIVATLTVKFPDIASVHTYVKVSDGAAGTAAGGDVDNRTYKNDETSLAVLRGTYDVVVVKGAQQKIVDAVNCTGSTCTVDGLVATLTVNFPGLSSVHTYVKTPAGGDVDNRTYKNDTTSLAVLKASYKVTVVKGAQQNIYDVNCTGATCTLDGITATLTVNFPGLSSVHTYVKTPAGGDVDNRTYKNDTTSLAVLEGTYRVIVVKGARQKTVEPVDCTDAGTCRVDDIVATLTVKFPGISSVHTYVKVDDGVAGTAAGGDVDNRTYKTNETSLAVLKAVYDVVVVKGAKQKIVDSVDCTGAACTVEDIVATVTLHFPGKTGVHVYFKVDDGVAGTSTGGDVDNRTYQNNSTTLVVLKNTYDVVIKIGADTYLLDAVNAYANPAVYTLTVIKLLNSSGGGLADGAARYYDGSWHALASTPASGVLVTALPGAPRNLLFGLSFAHTYQEKWQNTATSFVVVFQTRNVEVQLKDSSGALMDTGTVRYYTGAWHDLGSTAGGKVNAELLPSTILFGMTHQFVYNEKWQDVGVNAAVVFQTKNVVIELKDSGGNLIPDAGGTGELRYYTGAWHTFASGITSGGTASLELLPANILFGITHQFVYTEKWQQTGTDATVVFQTRNVEVQLQDSSGALMDTGTVRYYTGAWHDLGSTAGGKVNAELLPASILFGMTHQFVYNEKWQNTTGDPVIVFQTGQVHSASGAAVNYYTGAWHPFTNDMQLLPGNVLFDFSDATPDTWISIGGGAVNNIH